MASSSIHTFCASSFYANRSGADLLNLSYTGMMGAYVLGSRTGDRFIAHLYPGVLGTIYFAYIQEYLKMVSGIVCKREGIGTGDSLIR